MAKKIESPVIRIGSKAIVLGMLFKADVANPNASWTEENVTPLKKIEAPDGSRYPYISGQALRRYLRDTLEDNLEVGVDGNPLYTFSPQELGTDPKSPILTAGRPDQYIDDDLLGFMRATKGKTRRRESPLRVSAGFGLFPYMGDRDLGTRSALQVTNNPESGGAIFETEITSNIFRSTWLLELDRVGRWRGYEDNSSKDEDLGASKELNIDERRKRVKAVLKALKYFSGGARQTRLLIEFVPQFVIYARMKKKVPIFLNALNVVPTDGGYVLNTASLREVVKDYAADIEKLVVGMRDGFLTNTATDAQTIINGLLSQEGTTELQVMSVGKAIEAMITDIDSATF